MADSPSPLGGRGSRRSCISLADVFQRAQAAVRRVYERIHRHSGGDDVLTERPPCNGAAKSTGRPPCNGAAKSTGRPPCNGAAKATEEPSCNGAPKATKGPSCNGTAKAEDGLSDISTTFSPFALGDITLPTRVSKAGPPADPLAQQEGKIEWVHDDSYSQIPEWRCEPDTSIIKEIVAPQLEAHGFGWKDISIEFFAGGGFNKLYTITSLVAESDAPTECIFRVTMPIDPWYKTESEIATMEYVRRYTSIPVPKVYAYDSSSDNKLGFEWIMMEKMAGKPLEEYWDMYGYDFDRFDINTKLCIARSVAEWVHQLSKLIFDKIGSLYIDWDSPQPCFKLGRLVHGEFICGDRLGYRVYRGPFRDAEQFYRSVIDIQLQDVLNPIQRTRFNARMLRIAELEQAEAEREEAGNESDSASSCGTDASDLKLDWYTEEDFTNVPRDCHALLSVLPLILPQDVSIREPMTLYHSDMSQRNVLLDDSGNLVGLVDWEMIGTRPYDQLPIFPPFMDNGGHDITTLSDWTSGEKDRTRGRLEREYAQTWMGREFRKYLEGKESPWLRTFVAPPPVTIQLKERVHQIPRRDSRITDWVKRIEEGKEWNWWDE